MAQDYNIQIENLRQLKIYLSSLIESLNQMKLNYGSAIDSSRQNGLPLQMYERFKGHNIERMYSAINSLTDTIEQIDIKWVNNLIDGFTSALEIAGSRSGGSTDTATASERINKVERFREGSERVRRIAEQNLLNLAIWKKAQDDQPQNQRTR